MDAMVYRICELGVAEDGMAATEYAIILALLVIVAIAALLLMGDGLDGTFNYFKRQFADAGSDSLSGARNLGAQPVSLTYAHSPTP